MPDPLAIHGGVGMTAPFAFTPTAAGELPESGFDRADRLRGDNAALDALWPDARVILLDDSGHALADATGALAAPTGRTLSQGPGGSGLAIFLGLAPDGEAWFSLDAGLVAFQAPERVDLRSAAAHWPAAHAAVFAQARALQHWHRQHRHCGACGAETAIERGGWLRRCTGCGQEHYPRTDPAVIVAISDGERLLLGRQANWPARRWSVIAGFVEPGESLEQAVAREVAEETGLHVVRCRYRASQPWPFPGQLMLGFMAEATPADPRIDDELEQARWFSFEEISHARQQALDGVDDGEGPLLSPAISISRWLIEQWWLEMRARRDAR
ncbi:NAD(+) diphosphatase [Marilutibacter aestuarii]